MDFIVKFAQIHETFRVPEIQALATIEGIDLKIVDYKEESPICVVQLPSIEAAKRLIERSILAQSIHEFWGRGETTEKFHESIKNLSSSKWPTYKESSFRFDIDAFRGSRSKAKRLELINALGFIPLDGPIKMKNAEELFTIFEIWPLDAVPNGVEYPDDTLFGRHIAMSSRDIIPKLELKKRKYISTTSMDSELALITANIALAAPGKLFYDPFVGTGSFPIACSYFGATSWGSDIDGRSIRGEENGKSLLGNFQQYSLTNFLGGAFAADLTNSPIRRGRPIWDGIVCDPPYGVREGLRVLGLRDPEKTPWLVEKGLQSALAPDYIPPKKPYSFLAILDDILMFAVETLVDNGRLSFWMPTANEEDQQILPPTHPCLKIEAICVQVFNRWSRRLITYSRIPDAQVSTTDVAAYNTREGIKSVGTTANELNPFRRGYFRKFKADTERDD